MTSIVKLLKILQKVRVCVVGLCSILLVFFFLPSLFRVDLAVLVCRLQGFFRQPIGDVHNQRRHLRAQKIH